MIPAAAAFRRLTALGLFGGFDAGSFARLHEQVIPAASLEELTGPRPVADEQIRMIVAAHYAKHPHDAARDRVLVLVKPLTNADLAAAANTFATAIGVELQAGFAPISIADVADAIQNELMRTGRKERLWAVNEAAPFFVVRETVDVSEDGWLWDPPRPMLSRFANLVRRDRLDHLGKCAIDGITVHTLSSGADGVCLVTDGFRTRARFELVTFAWADDAPAVAADLVALGLSLCDGGRLELPVTADDYVIAGFGGPQRTFEGDIDFARVTPVEGDENVDDIEALGLGAAMDRWSR